MRMQAVLQWLLLMAATHAPTAASAAMVAAAPPAAVLCSTSHAPDVWRLLLPPPLQPGDGGINSYVQLQCCLIPVPAPHAPACCRRKSPWYHGYCQSPIGRCAGVHTHKQSCPSLSICNNAHALHARSRLLTPCVAKAALGGAVCMHRHPWCCQGGVAEHRYCHPCA